MSSLWDAQRWADQIQQRLRDVPGVVHRGRITHAVGTTIRARLPEARLGARCVIRTRDGELPAEVVGFEESRGAILMPLGHADGVGLDDSVELLDEPPRVPVGAGLLGRVLDACGRPIDRAGPVEDVEYVAPLSRPPNPLQRQRIETPLCTGIRAVDGLLTTGVGQRVGIFAPAGGGKTTLLSMLARGVSADVVVVALIGERGREVAPFLQDNLGAQGLRRSVVVVSTSDEPALLRLRAAHTAMSIAEAFRATGRHVVLLMDSVTRFARALREAGLAAGELPARRGYPPSVFAELPRLFERAGCDAAGAITAFFTVLLESDDDEDPIGEETRSLLDGHWVLSPVLARRQHYPAIDPLRSKSRLMSEIATPQHRAAAARVVETIARYEENRARIELGLYEPGTHAAIDAAIEHMPAIEAFLRQRTDEIEPFEATIGRLCEQAKQIEASQA